MPCLQRPNFDFRVAPMGSLQCNNSAISVLKTSTSKQPLSIWLTKELGFFLTHRASRLEAMRIHAPNEIEKEANAPTLH